MDPYPSTSEYLIPKEKTRRSEGRPSGIWRLSIGRHVTAKTKRRLLYVNISVLIFLSSVEYAVILPSLWLYLHNDFNASTSFLGLCLAAYSISSLLFCPIFGILNDKIGHTKTLVVVCNSFEILGNVLYLVRSQWIVFFARFVAGIGTAAAPLMFADVSRVTPKTNRTAVLSVILMFRQIGLLVGPALNLFLSQMDFVVFSIRIDQYTSPGFFMTILWILHQIQVLLTFFDVDDYNETRDPDMGREISASAIYRENVGSEASPHDFSLNVAADEVSPRIKANAYWREFSREEVIVLIFLSLLVFYAQTSVESIVTPFAESNFGWGEIETSSIFAGAAVGVLVVSVGVAVVSRRVADRSATIVGLFFVAASITWSLLTLSGIQNDGVGGTWLKINFIGSIICQVLSLAVTSITSFSLYTKCVGDDMQGFGTGLRRSIKNIGLILGPLWSGAMIYRLAALLTVNLILVLFVVALFLSSWRRMTPKREIAHASAG